MVDEGDLIKDNFGPQPQPTPPIEFPAAVAYSLWDCQHNDKLSDNPGAMVHTFKEAALFVEWLDRYGYVIRSKAEPTASDFKELAQAFLRLCEGDTYIDSGLDIIRKHLPLAEDGYYLEEDEEE
jgi:hypothetical protein